MMFKQLRKYFKQRYTDPLYYSTVAKRLSEGAPTVICHYSGYSQPRYYTGSGNICNNGFGLKRRWNVHVEKYVEVEPKVFAMMTSEYVWNDPTELELIQNRHANDLKCLSVVKYVDKPVDAVVKFLYETAAKLRPGQSYSLSGGYSITSDLFRRKGYQLKLKDETYIVPARHICLEQYMAGVDITKFDRSRVFIHDETLIKRQYRDQRDPKRWYECKQVPSVNDKWVLKLTSLITADAPVHYYTLDMLIDDPRMSGHPFYITDILYSAINELNRSYTGHHLEINTENIQVHWDNIATNLSDYDLAAQKYVGREDTHPIVILQAIHTHHKLWPSQRVRLEVM